MRKMTATYPARWLACLALLLAAAGASACGSDDDPAPPRDGALTIYTSLPRTGIQAGQAQSAAAGARLALEDAKGRAGERRVRLVELDSAGGEDDPWDPDAIEANANRAVDDDSAVAYVGELDLGGSAVSVPVTNGDGLLQVSPGDGLPSLTVADPGGGGESPARYYPEGTRSFIRLVPHAGLQAKALVDWARERGAKSIGIVRDEGVFGREVSLWALEMARRAGMAAEIERIRSDADDYEDVARDVAERRPGAVIVTAPAGLDSDRLVVALRRALPGAPLLGTSAVASRPPAGIDFVDPHLPIATYGGEARRVARRLRAKGLTTVRPEALYGYEAVRFVLDAVERAGSGAGRADVLRAARGPRRVDGVLPPYFVGPLGDVATSTLGSYRSSAGRVIPLGVRSAEITAPPP